MKSLSIVAALVLVGCGADDGSGVDAAGLVETQRAASAPSNDGMVSFLVKDESKMPACDVDREGQLAYVVSIESFFSCTEEEWLLADIKGEKGDRGERGLQGDRGVAGQDGRDGVDGVNGQDGAQGPQGEQGLQGERGADGAQGATGVAGQDGRDGQNGRSVAVRSSVVAQGATCAAGGVEYQAYYTDDNSDVGTPSTVCNGIQGATGATGAQGAQGATGVAGQDGADGQDGISVGIVVAAATAGQCPAGGSVFQPYLDSDRDGTQDVGESSIGSAQILCNGQNGADGAAGQDGQDGTDATLVAVSRRTCQFAPQVTVSSYVGSSESLTNLEYLGANRLYFEVTTYSNGSEYRTVEFHGGVYMYRSVIYSRWSNTFGTILHNIQNSTPGNLSGMDVVDNGDTLDITYSKHSQSVDPAYFVRLYHYSTPDTKVQVESVTWSGVACTTTDL